MAGSYNTSLRIIVSGIKKGPVQRFEKEDALRWFFHDAGCKVARVNLVMDTKRGDKSRGLGFVDFEDPESLNLALKLHNKEAKELAGKDGKLRIEKARAATDESRKRQQELSEARNQTEEMERELALHEIKLNKLVQELKRKCEWQNVAQSHGLQLQEEKRRQVVLRQAMETIKDATQRIHTAIEVDVISVHNGGANQGGCAIAASPPASFEPLARKEPAHKASPHPHPDAAERTADDQDVVIEADLLSWPEQVEIRVRNTFIEIGVPEAPRLVRSMSAPTSGTASPLTESEQSERRESDRWDFFSAADALKAFLEEKMDGASSMDGSTAATSEQESDPDQ